ncbi:hypothetical protein FCX93_14265 [Escherichia coli]|nr:hypothetical protein C7R96_07430 [Escherichia coli]QCH51827.1 hypothetical protein C8201_14915 [Escherichia coli O113:H21]EEV5980422.1 hypothetical protein [Escherichia coli]EEV6048072.1 hypothetical protein [Escherichia coli]EEV7372351.1 hypothetical protein [Escherichia coli]
MNSRHLHSPYCVISNYCLKILLRRNSDTLFSCPNKVFSIPTYQ